VPEHKIVIDIEIEAPPERVFDAWTDPAQLAQWWGDDSVYRTRNWQVDSRPGGRWSCEGSGGGGDMEGPFAVHGEYTVLERPHRLGFTWTPTWEEGRTTSVLIELTPTAGGTRLRLTHTGFATVESQEGHHAGWKRVLAWLGRHITSPQAPR
jgi:uncharacterized protein YndB with AHSA1/START domain